MNVIDTNGNLYASRLDPYASNTWFNGQVITDVKISYYTSFEINSPLTEFAYPNVYMNQANHQYYGSYIKFVYTNVDGYKLSTFKLSGLTNNLQTADNDYHAINLIGMFNGSTMTFRNITRNISTQSTVAGTSGVYKFTEGVKTEDDLVITVTYDATAGTYTFILEGDVLSFLSGGYYAEFYSTPEVFDVTYNSNKLDSSSPIIMNTFTNALDYLDGNLVENPYNVASQLTSTKICL